MRSLLCALLMGAALAVPAKADQVWQTISSVTLSGVTITSYTVIQVDSLNRGSAYTLPGRNKITLTLPSGSGKLNCGYTSSMSSQTTSVDYAPEIATTATQSLAHDVELPSYMKLFCLLQTGAAQVISISQKAPVRLMSLTP